MTRTKFNITTIMTLTGTSGSMTESAEVCKGDDQLALNVYSVDEELGQGRNTDTGLSPMKPSFNRGSNITKFSVLSFLGNAHSSLESPTPSEAVECAEKTCATSENVHSCNSDNHTNEPDVIKGGGCYQPMQESSVTSKELIENVCSELSEQPKPNDNSTRFSVQSTHISILDCKTKTESDYSSHITQLRNFEENDDSEKKECTLNHQKKNNNIESTVALISFPHKNPVTVYSVLQCLERAQFLTKYISDQDLSNYQLLSTDTCDKATLLPTSADDKAQLLSTNACDKAHILSTNADEQLLTTNTTDEPQQVPASTCDTIDSCKASKYNLRNNAKLSYTIDQSSDDDISEYVTSESDYMDSNEESTDSSSGSVQYAIKTPNIPQKNCMRVRPSCDPDGYQKKTRTETDFNIIKENLHQRSFASEAFDGRPAQLTSTESVVEKRHPITDLDFDEVMKWNACHACPVCKRVSANLCEFQEHFRLSYRCLNTYRGCTGAAYTCKLCNFKGKCPFMLVRHLVSKTHNKNETINFPADSLSTKPAHAVNGDATAKKKSCRLGYCCQICDRVVCRRYSATRHLKIHLKNELASCPVCQKIFSNEWLLHNHMKLHKTKSKLDVYEVKPSPSFSSSDHLNSRFHGKDTLPENEDESTGLTTDKHSAKMAKGSDNRAETNTAVSVLHDVSSSTGHDLSTSSERRQLPTTTGSTIHDMSTNTCGTTQLMSTNTDDTTQLLSTNTDATVHIRSTNACDTTQLLSTNTDDTVHILSTNTCDTTQLLSTNTDDTVHLLSTKTDDTVHLLSTNTDDTVHLLSTNTDDTAQLLSTDTCDKATLLPTSADDKAQLLSTNACDKAHILSTNAYEQILTTNTTDEPQQVPTTTCDTIDSCKASIYNLRNNAKLSYTIDQSSDVDISEYVTSERDYMDSDEESRDSSSGSVQCTIKTPNIPQKSCMRVRPSCDPDGYQTKTRTETDINIIKANLHKRSFASEAFDGRPAQLTSTESVVEERHPIIDLDFDEVMKWNACHACPVCKRVSGNLCKFQEHFRLSYKCRNTYRGCTGAAYTCKLCNFKGKDQFMLVRHLVSKYHNKNETINYPADSLSTNPAHAVNGDATAKKKSCRLGYCCQICGSVFCRRYGATRHLKIHLKNKLASCPVCQKIFSNKWSLHNHMKLHKTKSKLDVYEVKPSPSFSSSDHLNSRLHGKDTLPENENESTGLTTDKHSAKMAKGSDNRAETNTAVSVLHDVSSLTETEHRPRQCTTDVIKLVGHKLSSQKYAKIEQMDIAEETQDIDDKRVPNVRSANPHNGHQEHTTATKTINTTENQVKLCFAFETSKLTKMMIFEQTAESHRYLEIHQLVKWNASHGCPVCQIVSRNQKEFHTHFVKSKKCRRFFLVTERPIAKFSCKPCSYLNKTFSRFLGHLMRNRKHGELTCETNPASDIKTDSDVGYLAEENSIDKDNVTGNSEVDARDDGEQANRRQSENEYIKRQSDKSGTNMDMHQSKKFKVGFSCQICGAVRSEISAAHRHLHRHTDNTLYECQTCHDHLILKGKCSPEHRCRNCGSKCFLLRNKASGKLVSRSLQKAYQCLVCEEHFFESHDLNVHMQHHVATDCTCGQCLKKCLQYPKEEPQSGVNKCNFCEKAFKCKLSLDFHYQSHSESAKPFMCDTCGEHFANKPCLSNHIRRKHLKTKNCLICKKAVDRELLRSHMKSHPSESKYTCDRCGKMFKQPHHLANHMLSHTSERSFTCQFCGYAFKMKHHMQSHIMTRHKDGKILPVQETKEDVTNQPVATKRKRNRSTCEKKIDNKRRKVTSTKGTRKCTLTAVDSSTGNEMPKKRLRSSNVTTNL